MVKKRNLCCTSALIIFFTVTVLSCYRPWGTIKLKPGTYNLGGINTQYNDYNLAGPPSFNLDMTVVFSTDANTKGANFDIWEGDIDFNVTPDGSSLTSKRNNAYLDGECNSSSNEFGPIFFTKEVSSIEDYGSHYYYSNWTWEVYLFASDRTTDITDATNDLNIYFYNSSVGLCQFGGNSQYDDAYPTYNYEEDTLYFCSNRGDGIHYSIYGYHNQDTTKDFDEWLNKPISSSDIFEVPVLSSSGNDKCPYILGNIMLLVSDREGGFGGYDIYYSVFKNGQWTVPVNMGEMFNSASNEFKATLYSGNSMSWYYYPPNRIILFSSDRIGGKGGFDLYMGILPENYIDN